MDLWPSNTALRAHGHTATCTCGSFAPVRLCSRGTSPQHALQQQHGGKTQGRVSALFMLLAHVVRQGKCPPKLHHCKRSYAHVRWGCAPQGLAPFPVPDLGSQREQHNILLAPAHHPSPI